VNAGEGLLMDSGLRPPAELDWGAEEGRSSSGVDTTGTGEGRWFPVPGRRSLWSDGGNGTGVTVISRVEVTVIGRSASLLLTMRLLDELSDLESEKNWLNACVRSNLRDSSCEEDELESEEVSDVVGAAGAVVLVTIWRLMCRGK
jgi:hypothetical protein